MWVAELGAGRYTREDFDRWRDGTVAMILEFQWARAIAC